MGRFDLTALSTFLAVMEAGGVSSAARRLGLARSVVSKRVAELEVALATPLSAVVHPTVRRLSPGPTDRARQLDSNSNWRAPEGAHVASIALRLAR